MKTQNREIGRLAEDLATQSLLNEGFEILERNFSNKFGEIDIIAKDNEAVVFVEVKAKKGKQFGSPEEMVNKKKLFKIKNMANFYLKGATVLCRIDVVAIVLDEANQLVSLKHYENVY